jgi:hypothetical protein
MDVRTGAFNREAGITGCARTRITQPSGSTFRKILFAKNLVIRIEDWQKPSA